ncbi:hypothetical protein EJ05DRAFT_453541 [Pseudovirgaria hyperparasitica]|uniref:dual-specificity kinase n=1 Tax=Pseudovirgaria hyperparasitica TaxID=470096 RepID=A0A6A6W543_9PEZI|nr:uncharacterized protein EJ05DRAFT_453541 [Pseudovirgaria hyperparasitica]KAF2757713.1 hypothetical protein EJ05DRAFT_453541 [Pseudovirgaria hyperparasitica]
MATNLTSSPHRAMENTLSLSRLELTDESVGSGGEGPARRKYPRTLSENQKPSRRQALPSNSNSGMEQQKPPPTMTARRQSIRDHKPPLGPRPLDQPTSRRVISGDSTSSILANRSFLPTSTSESVLTQTRGSNPRYSFGKAAEVNKHTERTDNSSSYDFLPSINFDDLHSSLSIPSYEPELSEFPAPGGGRSIFASTKETQSTNDGPSTTAMGRYQAGQETQVRRSGSLVRRSSNARRQVSSTSTAETGIGAMGPPSAPLSVRNRRQSQFPAPAPTNPAAKPPRKSVGPGLLTTSLEARGRQDMPQLGTESPRSFLGRSGSIERAERRQNSLNSGPETPRLSTGTRNVKARSMQPAPRQTSSSHLTAASMTPDHPSTAARSPGKSPGQANHTPSSSGSKRQSTLPAHASGLGARTISPTDARRLKRLSMLPNPAAAQQKPPTPPDFAAENLSTAFDSPSAPFRKSITPSSPRVTPDPNRKSVTSGLSLSASSSFNSLRASNLPNRSSIALAGSRLPTPKGRNVHSSAGAEEEEEVPPVPAIPKAYESPKEIMDHPSFPFSKTKSSTFDESRLGQSMIEDSSGNDKLSVDGPVSEIYPTMSDKAKVQSRHKRGMTIGSGSQDVDKAPPIRQVAKPSRQPLRLPPLNLLPLSTPTASRIASFPAPSAEVDNRHDETPPPKSNVPKTPSTPMTASKASFSFKDTEYENSHLRSNSSHYTWRSDTAFQPMSTAAIPIPSHANSRQTTTPFASASLPKISGEFGHIRSRPSGEYGYDGTDSESQQGKSHGQRSYTAVKQETASIQSIQTDTSTEPETPSSGPSLHRRLSEKFKRSSSKASGSTHSLLTKEPVQHKSEDQQPSRSNEMPPPKLPASKTLNSNSNSNILPSPTPGKAPRSSFEQRTRKPSGQNFMSDTETEKRQVHRRQGSSSVQPPTYSEQNLVTPKNRPGFMDGLRSSISNRPSLGALRGRNLDTNLEKEDIAADEEMKRLGYKRKDFELAAKDVDKLRDSAKPQPKVTPAAALAQVNLNLFERGEIIDYKEIYFCGTRNAKKHVGDLNAQSANFGYDDDRGDYNIVFGDHLAYRYEVVDLLGKGSFGQVVRCVDHKTGSLVAVKIIRNKKRFHQQALVEVNILQKLREWDPKAEHSMINFTQSFYFRGHLCISTELLSMNLYEFIKAHEFKGFSIKLIRRFTRQILSCLQVLQTKRVIHCDLKPENILLAHPLQSEIKVIDFGSSCFENEKVYTYIQSRFYRSPEVILGMSYGMPIDMWSLGCILAELYTGYPIFPGENEQEQLACIMEIFGPPEKHLIEKSSRKKLFFDSQGKARVMVSSKGRRRRPSTKTLQQALKCDDEAFLDFISRCLRWDPERRMKPDDAASHEFMTGQKRPSMLRPRGPINGTSGVSPAKRLPSAVQQTPQRTRPLPEPPATTLRNGIAVANSRETSSSSPVKGAGPRRHSTIHGNQTSVGVKRSSNGQTVPTAGSLSGLPRVAQRSTSGKLDLASAAAAASLVCLV